MWESLFWKQISQLHYSDADSTLPFEEGKNNPTDEKIPETEEQTPEKTDSENQILTWMDLYQETLLLRTKRKQSMS